METNYIWRLLILDKSGMYTQIYDEVYGSTPEALAELQQAYADPKKYVCLLMEP